MPAIKKSAGPNPASIVPKIQLLLFVSALAVGVWLHFGKLREICFPASFTAFTGYTPEESIRLWQDLEQPDRRYTRCVLNEDGSISLFVTRAQQIENLRIYRESLQGWTAHCKNAGVAIHYTADHRQLSCLADSEKAWAGAAGDIRALETALACLQIMEGSASSSWSVSVRAALKDDPDYEIFALTIPRTDQPG